MSIKQGVIPSRKIKKTAYAEGLHFGLFLVEKSFALNLNETDGKIEPREAAEKLFNHLIDNAGLSYA